MAHLSVRSDDGLKRRTSGRVSRAVSGSPIIPYATKILIRPKEEAKEYSMEAVRIASRSGGESTTTYKIQDKTAEERCEDQRLPQTSPVISMIQGVQEFDKAREQVNDQSYELNAASGGNENLQVVDHAQDRSKRLDGNPAIIEDESIMIEDTKEAKPENSIYYHEVANYMPKM